MSCKAYYGTEFVDCFESVSRKNRMDTPKSYEKALGIAAPYAVKLGIHCIDKDEPLFRVTGIICGESKRQLIIVMSLSSVLGDIATLYSFLGMIADADSSVLEVSCDRAPLLSSKFADMIGKPQSNWIKSMPYSIGRSIQSKISKRSRTSVYFVNDEWTSQQQQQYSQSEENISVVSVLSAWFMNICKCDFSFMTVNFRELLDIGNNNDIISAGNYLRPLMFRPSDYSTPATLRDRIPGPKNRASIRPAIPTLRETLRFNSCFISDFSAYYQNVNFPGLLLTLHIPILFRCQNSVEFELYCMGSSSSYYKHELVIFRATHNSLGLLIFERGLKLSPYLKIGPLKKLIMEES